MEQQIQCVNEDVTLLPLDQLAAIKPMGINACAPFSALFTLWLSRIQGRRAGLIKLLWHDGIGLCMLTKRLEQGQFAWPSATSTGRIALSAAQLAALLDGCEWRAPVPRARPELAG
jgi:hypothetical protein